MTIGKFARAAKTFTIVVQSAQSSEFVISYFPSQRPPHLGGVNPNSYSPQRHRVRRDVWFKKPLSVSAVSKSESFFTTEAQSSQRLKLQTFFSQRPQRLRGVLKVRSSRFEVLNLRVRSQTSNNRTFKTVSRLLKKIQRQGGGARLRLRLRLS